MNNAVTLPFGRYDRLSRGKGWARLGRGDSARWGKKTSEGWEVYLPGVWTVGTSDGFKRFEQTEYTVVMTEEGLALMDLG